MKIIKAEGIVIKKINFGEADIILKVFTKDYGKIDIYVNGIRKSKKRDRLAVELLSVTDFLIYEKNSKYVSNSFNVNTFFPKIQLDYTKLQYSYYLLHLIDKVYENNSEDYEFYEKIKNILEYINLLNETNEVNELLLSYLMLYLLKYLIMSQGIYDYENILEKLSDENQKKVLDSILNNSAKSLIKQKKYTKAEITDMIIYLEGYINYNLNINLRYKFFV